MCDVLAVSESGYYRSLKPTPKQERQQLLLVKIKDIIGIVSSWEVRILISTDEANSMWTFSGDSDDVLARLRRMPRSIPSTPCVWTEPLTSSLPVEGIDLTDHGKYLSTIWAK